MPNIMLVKKILRILGKPESLITFVTDRPGHDRRYAVDPGKIKAELGWEGNCEFDAALAATVEWYVQNRQWWERVKSGEYMEYYEKYGRRS